MIRLLSAVVLLATTTAPLVRADDSAAATVDRWIENELAAGRIASAVRAEVSGDRVDVRGFGRRSASDGTPPDAATQFQIGSITKVFTHLLLAEMAAQGRVRDDDTLARHLPATFKPRNPAVAEIRLRALATHTSGLPRLPVNLRMDAPDDPYARYTADDLIEGINRSREDQPLGTFYAYSNFGVGLLGHVLGRVDGKGYADAVHRQVIAPLRLAHLTAEPGINAVPATSGGKPVNAWRFDDALIGAGGLWGSAADLAQLIQVYLGAREHTLKHALDKDLQIAVTPPGPFAVTRVWHVAPAGERRIYWHNGGTAGFHSFMGFDTEARRGVVVLISGDADPTGIGMTSLGHTTGAQNLPAVDRATLGQYQITPEFGIGLREIDGVLVAQATGQAPVVLHAVGADWLALGEVDASLRLIRNGETVSAIELVQNGVAQRGRRSADVATAAQRMELALDAGVLDQYPGVYTFAPGVELDVRRTAEGLEARLTGQPYFPVFARAHDRFFYKVVDAELEFRRNREGKIEAVLLHQAGVVQRAARSR